MSRRLALVGVELWLPALVVAMWWILSSDSQTFYFPPLSEVLTEFRRAFLSDDLIDHLGPSLEHLSIGFAIATAAGIGIGVVVTLNRWVRMTVNPLVQFLRALPPPALLPFAIVALGIGPAMKIWIIAFGAFFPILLNTIDGIRGLDLTARDTSRVYRLPRRLEIVSVLLPGASPQIFTGLRAGLQVALLLMVISEMVASTGGIGYFILQSQQQFAIPEMWAGMIMLGLLGYALNGLFTLAERRALAWYLATHGSTVR